MDFNNLKSDEEKSSFSNKILFANKKKNLVVYNQQIVKQFKRNNSYSCNNNSMLNNIRISYNHQSFIGKENENKLNFIIRKTIIPKIYIYLFIIFVLSPIFFSKDLEKPYITIQLYKTNSFEKVMKYDKISQPNNIFYNLKNYADSSSVKYKDNYIYFKCTTGSSCTIKLHWGRKKQNETENVEERNSTSASEVETQSLSDDLNADYMFGDCNKIISIDFSKFYTTRISSMSHMFYQCSWLESISNLEVGSVTNLEYAFFSCENLESLTIYIQGNDDKNMEYMFYECNNLKSFHMNLNYIDTAKYMFYNCQELNDITITKFRTKNLKDMSYMFYNCKSLESLDLTHFSFQSATALDYMFKSCTSLTSLISLNFNPNCKSMKEMFYGCKKLKNIDLSNFIGSGVENMDKLFYNCKALETANLQSFKGNLVTDFSYMFYNCRNLKNVNLNSLESSTPRKVNNMFQSCSSLLSIQFLFSNTFSNPKEMFSGCTSITYIGLSTISFSQTDDMSFMFYDCTSVTSIEFKQAIYNI